MLIHKLVLWGGFALLLLDIRMGYSFPLGSDRFDGVELKAELTYRQALLDRRRQSAIYDAQEYRDYVDQTYFSMALVSTRNFVDKVVLEPSFYTRRRNPDQLEFNINQAFVDVGLSDHFRLVGGKKAEQRGVGFVYTPSDLLNPNRDIFDPLQNKEGKAFTRLSGSFEWIGVGLGYIPEVAKDFHQGVGWMSLSVDVGNSHIEIDQTHDRDLKTSTGLAITTFPLPTLELHIDARYDARSPKSGERPDSYYQKSEKSDGNMEGVLGARFVLSSTFSIVAEGIYRSNGLNKDAMSLYYSDQRTLADNGESVNQPFDYLVGQRYLVLGLVQDQLTQGVRLRCTGVSNLIDKSGYAAFNLAWLASAEVEVSYSPLIFIGRPNTEFGENPIGAAHYFALNARI